MNDKQAIRLDRISKRFAGSNVDTVRELSLDIPRGWLDSHFDRSVWLWQRRRCE